MLIFFSVEELRSTLAYHSSPKEAVDLTGRRLMYEIERAVTLNLGNMKNTLRDQYDQLEILMRRHKVNN